MTECFLPPRRNHILLRGLPEHPLDSVVKAGHRKCDSHPGQPGVLYVPDPGHLGLLRDLCAFPWGLPVPCAHCHVSEMVWEGLLEGSVGDHKAMRTDTREA